MSEVYLLKDLSRLSGHSTHTLKFYLRMGLLKEIGRSPETNFRYFNDETLRKLQKIRELKAEGISLREIQDKFSANHELL